MEKLAWQRVADEEELDSRGAWLRVVVGDSSLIVLNDGERVRAFYDACQHRGHPLMQGEGGQCTQLRCPLHGWTYTLQGALTGRPGPEDFPGMAPEELALRPLPCRVVDGGVEVAAG